MTKSKCLIIILIVGILFFPYAVNAATETGTATSTTSTGKTVQWSYKVQDGKIVDLKCTNVDAITGELEIPTKLNDMEVISLAENSLKNAVGITKVTIPKNIITIGNSAFNGCLGIKTIVLSEGVTHIGSYAFNNCSGLSNINIPKSVVSIQSSAFGSCSSLKSIEFPDNTILNGTNMFYGCTTLNNVKLPKCTTKIGFDWFQYCKALKYIELPENVSTIDADAFYGASSLVGILIPDNVSYIARAFSGNSKDLTIYGSKGSYAESYAKENNIQFDLISNWNTKEEGKDITAPSVKSIQVVSPSSGTYKTSQTVKIRVCFSEKITGTTVPTLKIKFGESAVKEVSNGTIKDDYIEYSYNIQDSDKGQLATVSLTGGTIKDNAGNDATLSCPIISGNTIKANVDGTTTNNTNNQDKTNTNNNNSNSNNNTNNNSNSNSNNNNTNNKPTGTTGNNSNNSSNSNSSTTTTNKDTTTATGKIPQTGEGITVFAVASIVIGLAIFGYIRYNKYRDI